MLNTQTVSTTVPYRVSELASSRAGLSRLFSAAVVSREFRDELLRDPEAAIGSGYYGQSFALTSEEKALVVSIRADSLSDLARQVNRALR